jgi:hypothetical protein
VLCSSGLVCRVPCKLGIIGNCKLFMGSKFSLGYDFAPGARGSVVVKALCYKSEGRGIDTR